MEKRTKNTQENERNKFDDGVVYKRVDEKQNRLCRKENKPAIQRIMDKSARAETSICYRTRSVEPNPIAIIETTVEQHHREIGN